MTPTGKAVTDLIHGPQATAEAIRASEIPFGGELTGISEATFNDIVGEVPTKLIDRPKLEGTCSPLIELLALSGRVKTTPSEQSPPPTCFSENICCFEKANETTSFCLHNILKDTFVDFRPWISENPI
jgi:hypothetical protein